MDTDAVLQMLREVAEEVIDPRFRSLAGAEVHEKRPGDLVTDADREAEVLITARLRAAYPDAVVLGEEAHSADASLMERYEAADHAFTVDPVDGTKNFVHGSPDHAVMASEVVRGEVVRAWIWQPQHGRAYVAERGAGAWRDGERLTRPPVGDAPRGVTSRRSWIGRSLGDLPALELTWISCGIDYPHLVEGDADYVLYSGTHPWDHAPGSLLVREAGGQVVTTDGSAYRPVSGQPGLVVAADAALGERVVGLL